MIVQVTPQFDLPYPHECDNPTILRQSYKIMTKHQKVSNPHVSPYLEGKDANTWLFIKYSRICDLCKKVKKV